MEVGLFGRFGRDGPDEARQVGLGGERGVHRVLEEQAEMSRLQAANR